MKVIGKVEKGFELNTKARNLRLHLKGDTLHNQPAHSIFQTIVYESYYEGKQIEFLNLTKPEITKDFVFLTLVSEEARDSLLSSGITYAHERIKVSITRDKDMGNPSEQGLAQRSSPTIYPKRNPKSQSSRPSKSSSAKTTLRE